MDTPGAPARTATWPTVAVTARPHPARPLTEPLLGGSPRARAREAAIVLAAITAGAAAAALLGAALWYTRPLSPGAVPPPRKGAAVAVVWGEDGGGGPPTPRLILWSGKGHHPHPPSPASPVAVFANLDDAWTLTGLVGKGGRRWARVERLLGAGAGRGGSSRDRPPHGAAPPLSLAVEPAPRWKAIAAGAGHELVLFGGDAQVEAGGGGGKRQEEDDYLADAWRLALVGGGSGGGGGGGGGAPTPPACSWPWPLPCHAARPRPADPPAALWDPLLSSHAAAPRPRRAAAGAVVGMGGDRGGRSPASSSPALIIAGGRAARKGDGLWGDVWALALSSPTTHRSAWTRLFPPEGCPDAPRRGRDSPACEAAWAAAPGQRKGAAAVAAPAGLVTPGPALIISGGRTDAYSACYFADAWAFDVVARAWTRLDGGSGSGAGSRPPGRDHGGALLDASASPPRLLVYGGRGGETYATSTPLRMDEVWALPLLRGGGGAWRLVRPPAAPNTRHNTPSPRFLFGYDSFTHGNVSYGVVVGGDGGGGGLLNDAWRYGDGVWTRLG